MNTSIIVILVVFSLLLFMRLKNKGNVIFLHTIMNLCILTLITLLLFLTLDKNLIHNINEKEIEKASDKTIIDVNKLTTISLPINSKIKTKEFADDKKAHKKNEEILIISISVLLSILVVSFFLTYKFDKDFYKNTIASLRGILIIKLVDIYIIYSIKQNYKGKDIDEIRNLLIRRFKEIAS